MIKMNIIPFSQFTNIHQSATINAGVEGRVFYFQIPKSMVGFMNKIGNNYFTGTILKLFIDGELIEDNIKRIIAMIDQPQEYNPPYLVKNSIEVRCTNNDTSAHTLEVLVDGVLIQKNGD